MRVSHSTYTKRFYSVFVEWWVVVGGGGGVGVGKGLNDSSVPTEQGIYDWIDTGTKWRRRDGGRDRVKFRDAIASKNLVSSKSVCLSVSTVVVN